MGRLSFLKGSEQTAKRAFCILAAVCAALSTWAAHSGKPVVWTDASGREVSVFGVNYYAPFWADYDALTARGLDLHRVIDDDIAHFRRLGLDCLRLHAIDCQISTEDGALVDNGHLEAFDYLVSAAISNGMKVVLTPIAWFSPRRSPGDPNGFSRRYAKERLCCDPALEPVVTRFLRAFVSHTNRYTRVRLADEPGVIAFECFNEPKYELGFTDAQLTAKVNAFADAIRSTGTKTPVFYSVWQGRTEAVCAGRIDGITASAYPTGIQHGCETNPPDLDRLSPLASLTNAAAAGKARLVYEFDSADTCATYLVPALALMFRRAGVQAAAAFQYDALPLAAGPGRADARLGGRAFGRCRFVRHRCLFPRPNRAGEMAPAALSGRLPRRRPVHGCAGRKGRRAGSEGAHGRLTGTCSTLSARRTPGCSAEAEPGRSVCTIRTVRPPTG